MPLALIGPWFARRGTSYRRFATWSVGFFALQLVLFSALRLEFEGRDSPHNGRYFFWFAAPAILIGVGTLHRLSSGRRWVRGLIVVAIIGQFALFATAWHTIASWHLQAKSFLGRDAVRRMLGEVVEGNRVIASNQPQVSAWFQWPSLDLPAGRPRRAGPPQPRVAHPCRLPVHRHQLQHGSSSTPTGSG